MTLATGIRMVRGIRSAVCAAVAAGLLASAAWAGMPQSDQNAALRYWRAFDMDNQTLDEILAASKSNDWAQGWRPDEEFLRDLESQRGMIDALLEASLLEQCDFGVDYQKGFEALLPHLGKMRRGAMLLMLEARVLADRGDIDGAVDRTRAVYAMAEHVTDDRILISSLVSLAMFRLADEMVISLQEAGLLAPDHSATLGETLMRFDQNDPFAIKRSIESERDITLSYLRRIVVERGIEGTIAYLDSLMETDEDLEAEMRSAIPDEKSLDRQIASYEEYYTLVLQAWDRPDAQSRISDLEKLYIEGKDGYIVGNLAVAARTIHTRYIEGGEHYRQTMRRVGLSAPEPLSKPAMDGVRVIVP